MSLYHKLLERFQELGMMAEGEAMHENTRAAMDVFAEYVRKMKFSSSQVAEDVKNAILDELEPS
jgi:hypothetical protein